MEANLGVSPSGTTDEVVKSYVDSFLGNRAATAYVATSETTTSTSFTDLATTTDTVTVTVGASGVALVILYSSITCPGYFGAMGYAASGANTVAATTTKSLIVDDAAATTALGASATFLEVGLSPGSTTFKAKYCSGNSSATQTFVNRRISVVPL